MRTLLFLLLWSPVAVASDQLTLSSSNQQVAVLELYTSEGCSSCPPADQWLSKLIELPPQDLQVLALAFHVDYWDYIGWKDPYANAQFTGRQRRLATENRQSTIYTPEFFINGQETRGTHHLIHKIQKINQARSPVRLLLDIDRDSSALQLQLKAVSRAQQNLKVQYVVFEDNLLNEVTRGENAGRQLQHEHVVRYLSDDINFFQTDTHRIPLQANWNSAQLGIAAIVYRDNGDYLQAVHGRLP